MQFTTERDMFKDALKVVKAATGRGSVVAGLVHLEAMEGEVALTCTNIELTIRTILPARDVERGSLLLPHSTLSSLLGPLKGGGPLTISDTGGQEASIESTSASLTVRKPRDASVWPIIKRDTGDKFEINANSVELLRHLPPFAAVPPVRPTMQGIHLLDDHAFATNEAGAGVVHVEGATFPGITVPTATFAAVLGKVEGAVECEASEEQITLTSGSTSWTSVLVAGEFPAAALLRIMNPANAKTIKLTTADVSEAIGVATSVYDGSTAGTVKRVELIPDMIGSAEIHSSSESGTVAIDVACETEDWDWPFSFDPKYLKVFLGAVKPEEFTLSASKPLTPIVADGGDFRTMFAPVKTEKDYK